MLQEINLFGLTFQLYNVMNAAAFIVQLAFFVLQAKKFLSVSPHASKQKSIQKQYAVSVAEIAVLFALGNALLLLLNRTFGLWFTNGNANYFGSLAAWLVVFLVFSKLFSVSPLMTADLFSLSLPLTLFVSKLACVFEGCCHSFEMQGSFYYNQYTERYEFPVQLVEALVALGIFIFLRVRRKKLLLGEIFPVYLIVYSASRFLTEFLRDDLPRVFSAFNAYQILSVIYFLLGVYLYMLVREKGKTIQSYFDAKRKQS